ncbi:MAG: murein biosynthesis integral membrane protein MurJ [Thermoanaerobaculia bacterium]
MTESSESRSTGAARVALGILLSRLMGLAREVSIAFFFGAGPHSDVVGAIFRGPNLLQNLLGEQTLSASFIPVYTRLLHEGREEEAGRFAGAIFGLLLGLVGFLSIVGVVLARPVVMVFAPGFIGDAAAVNAGLATVDRFALAVGAVKFIFPMTGFLVLSAWSLGILNSHRKFFLPYFAPVLWNAAIISGVWWVGGRILGSEGPLGPETLGGAQSDMILLGLCVGALVGGLLQFLVQVPAVVGVLRGFRLSVSLQVQGVRQALRAFTPLTAGRGAVQLSSYLDLILASFLAAGAVASLRWSLVLYTLPISLFGMSVAAAELPEMSRRLGSERGEELRRRVESGLLQMYFLTVPTFVGYLVFGFLITGALYRRGRFQVDDQWLVYLLLASYSLGLLATTTSRLLNNVFYARGHTKIPARIAMERVLLSGVVGVSLMFRLDRISVTAWLDLSVDGPELYLGVMALAIGAAVGSWYEIWRLLRALQLELPGFRLPSKRLVRLLGIAVAATVPAILIWYIHITSILVLEALLVLGVYVLGYFGATSLLGVSELNAWAKWTKVEAKQPEENG